jgi:DNA-binding Lrp family transcriptional regulator
VSTEFFLRSFELIGELHGDIVSCLVIMTLWHDALVGTGRRKPMGIRELSRRLDFPFETVRRHVRRLVRNGVCVAEGDGIGLAATMQRSARMADILRKIYLNAIRMLGDFRRIGVVTYRPRRSPSPGARHLDKEQTAIAVAAIGVLLAAMKVLRGSFRGDLVSGLVFTAIRAANVKHVTNTAPAATRGILPDSDRLPVSISAIADSMRLPYETVRRHTRKLVKDGKCVRVGRRGLMVPGSTFRQMTVEANAVLQLVHGFFAELRVAGVKV